MVWLTGCVGAGALVPIHSQTASAPLIGWHSLGGSASKNNADAAAVLLECKSWGDVRQTLQHAPKKLKGDTFELLVQHCLKLSPEYGFRNVWSTQGKAPDSVLRKLNLQGRDTKGIDLIAKVDAGEYVAIQCKYHQDENRALA